MESSKNIKYFFVYYTFLIIFKKTLILLNNITQKKKKKFKKEKKEREKKEKGITKKISLKYITTVTPLTAIKVKGERGEATIQFTHFRSF